MLTGVHFLLSYTCTYECDHCFIHSSPEAEGTFTIDQVRQVLTEAQHLGTVEWIYFEGGEPAMYYPLLLESLRLAKGMGFKTGVVTNAYYGNTVEDAELWLQPLKDVGISDLSISDDDYHATNGENPAKNAIAAAEKLEMPMISICIEEPRILEAGEHEKGAPVIGGGVLFKGRAAEKLTEGLPRKNWSEFNHCPYEELIEPERVHVDAYGHVHVCQGISIGNMWETPFSEIMTEYSVIKHPILHPILKGGPAELARVTHSPHTTEFVDECHLCYTVRKGLLEQFPDELTPPQVYGI